jgi:hypothetical protein
MGTDESHFWLGCALSNLGRWDLAVAEFETIARSLERTDWEVTRLRNHAVALARANRADEAVRFLLGRRSSWPQGSEEELDRVARQLLNREIGHA